MKKIISLLMAAALSFGSMSAVIKVHTIGDSTMETYNESSTDKRGWATYLGAFFDSDQVTVNNRGKSGCSSRTFYTGAAQWGTVPQQFSAGDYLIIQFAHNDEKNNGMDVDTLNAYYTSIGHEPETDMRGTHPQTTYKEYLRKYINEARQAQVHPILMAPVARKYFNGNSIKRSGLHDLGDKFWCIENGVLKDNASVPASDHSMDYVQAMREVAAEMNVPFLDMTTASAEIYLQYGEAQCTALLFCQGDNTHFATMGANLIARRAAQMIKDSIPELAPYVNIPTSITANPAAVDFGETYSGVSLEKEVLLTGFGLEPAEGIVTITANGDLTVSTDKENYSTSVQASYAGNTLFQKVYIRALYTGEGAQSNVITVTSGDIQITVPVTASVISLEGGAAVSATWTIADKTFYDVFTVSGPISAAMTLSQMVAWDSKAEFSDGTSTDISMVRFHNADANGKANWPTDEIDENALRYIDFAITAPSTMDVRITGISMDVAAHSTSAMCYHLNTGFGDGFTDVQTIVERTMLTNKAIEHLALTPTLAIPAGETLHVRLLPWHQHTSGGGKYICVKDVKIEGMAFEPTEGIEHIAAELKAAKIVRNGQLMIKKGNVLYNATGTIVK